MLASKLVPVIPFPEYVPPAGLTLPKLVKSKVVDVSHWSGKLPVYVTLGIELTVMLFVAVAVHAPLITV